MYIDIHKHGIQVTDDVLVLRNLFPDQVDGIIDGKYFSLGLHPWHVNKTTLQKDLSIIEKYAGKEEIIAIGEIGLDNKVDVPYIDQIEGFEKQIEIAENRQKPIIIHCVKAYDDLM